MTGLDAVVLMAMICLPAGVVLFYLCSPHQRWRRQPLACLWRWPAALLLLTAAMSWIDHAGARSGLFIFLSLLMLLLALLPFSGLLRWHGDKP